jgi:hypothetical protein
MGVPAMPRHDGYKHGMVSGATTTKLEIAHIHTEPEDRTGKSDI